MGEHLLKTVGAIAGIGGLGIGALVLIFRDVIRRLVLPQLTKDHAYRIVRLILTLTWSVAVIGIVAWTLTTCYAAPPLPAAPAASSSTPSPQAVGIPSASASVALPPPTPAASALSTPRPASPQPVGTGGSLTVKAGDNGGGAANLDHVDMAAGNGTKRGGDINLGAGNGGPNGKGGDLNITGGTYRPGNGGVPPPAGSSP